MQLQNQIEAVFTIARVSGQAAFELYKTLKMNVKSCIEEQIRQDAAKSVMLKINARQYGK